MQCGKLRIIILYLLHVPHQIEFGEYEVLVPLAAEVGEHDYGYEIENSEEAKTGCEPSVVDQRGSLWSWPLFYVLGSGVLWLVLGHVINVLAFD